MNVSRITSFEEIPPTIWNRLAEEVPFRTYEWLHSWWNHYRAGRQLYILAVKDPRGEVIGLAPWYVERSEPWGRVIRFLGSGDVCSDYMTILASATVAEPVAEAIADWLVEHSGSSSSKCHTASRGWDRLELDCVPATDEAIQVLVARLERLGLDAHHRSGPSCWRVNLPGSWDELLQTLSKNHRKTIRRSLGRLDSANAGNVTLHHVESQSGLDRIWDRFVDLHRRRHQNRGSGGCFDRPHFEGFLREAAERLLGTGRLRMMWLALDDQAVAVEFLLRGSGTTYAYQSGMEPAASRIGPGHLAMTIAIRRAIDEGQRGFDFLRGDETYKARWRAQPRPNMEVRVSAPHLSARLRHRAWLAGSAAKRWMNDYRWLAPSNRRCESR